MANGYLLPRADFTRNALIDLRGLNSGIDNWQARTQLNVENARQNKLMQMREQQMAQANARAAASAARADKRMSFDERRLEADLAMRRENMGLQRERMGMDRERFGMQRQQFDDQRNERLAAKRGQLAMLADTPEKWAKLSQSVPEFAGKTREQVIAEGGLGREYMDFRLKQAKLPNPQQNAGNIAQGLSNLASIPKNYDAFDYATGEWRGDDKALLGPIGRAWGSVTSGIAGTQTSPGEVRRQIAGSTEALAASLKPLIRKPGEGTWTDADQARLVALVGDLAKANTRQQYYRALEGVRQRVRDNFGLNLPPIQGMPQGFYEQQTGKPQGRAAPASFQGFSAKEIR